MHIEDYYMELCDEDFEELVIRRLPKDNIREPITIINKSMENRGFISVAFCFKRTKEPHEAFYTHIYIPELEKYWNEVV